MKLATSGDTFSAWTVTPRAGVWIETITGRSYHYIVESHPPCGGVD